MEAPTVCEFVALIHRDTGGHRRRVLVEAYGIDLDTISDTEVASLFDNIVKFGWLWIGELS